MAATEMPSLDPSLGAGRRPARRGLIARFFDWLLGRTPGVGAAGAPPDSAGSVRPVPEAQPAAPLPFPTYAGEPPNPGDVLEGARPPLTERRRQVSGESLRYRPWLSICRLEVRYNTGRTCVATGFLTRSGLVATAAHVILHPDPSIGAATEITVHPPLAAGSGMAQVSRKFYRNATWGQNNDSFVAAFDYAAIRLPNPERLLTRCGCFDWGAPDRVDTKRKYWIAGYPGEKQGLWWHENTVVDAASATLLHDIMTTQGQSGSPLFYIEGDGVIAVGIHSKESENVAGKNVAHRVNAELIADFRRWVSEPQSAV